MSLSISGHLLSSGLPTVPGQSGKKPADVGGGGALAVICLEAVGGTCRGYCACNHPRFTAGVVAGKESVAVHGGGVCEAERGVIWG